MVNSKTVRIAPVPLDKRECGKISEKIRETSLRAFPPPCHEFSENERAEILEGRRIKWPKGLIPNYRTNPEPETIFYFRYSTDKQQFSAEVQKAICERYYARYGDRLKMPPLSTKEFADPETSGKRRFFERSWGGQLGRYVKKGDHVVVAYFDRFGRDAIDSVNSIRGLRKLGVHFHAIDNPQLRNICPRDPQSTAALHNTASAAEFERLMISKRTTAGLALRRDCGVSSNYRPRAGFVHKPNPNFDPSRKVGIDNPRNFQVVDEREQVHVVTAYHYWSVEGWSIYELSRAFRYHGFRRADGKKWDRKALVKAVMRIHRERLSLGEEGEE